MPVLRLWDSGNPNWCVGLFIQPHLGRTYQLATAFFISEVQCNFSLILGHDWIHADQCVPSTLHQFLIQWIGDEVEVVHGDTSSFIGTTDTELIGAHDHIKCLSGLDLTDYDLISCTKKGFVSAVLKPMENRLHLLL